MTDEKEMTAAEQTEEAAKEPETAAETNDGAAGEAAEETENTDRKAEDMQAEPEEAQTEEAQAEPEETIEKVTAEVVDDDETSPKGKRFWQKQGKAPKKDKKDELIEELNDKVQRQLAEFENFRKRTEKEKAQNYMIGARDVLEKMLPIVDNFERGLAGADLSDPFAAGMEKTYRQLSTALESLGVTPMNAAGKEFDPNFHSAVMTVDDETLGSNIVVEELQKGYMYKDTVLRYAMVKVTN